MLRSRSVARGLSAPLAHRSLSTASLPPVRHRIWTFIEKDMIPRARRMRWVFASFGIVAVGAYYSLYPERTSVRGVESSLLRAFEEGRGFDSFQSADKLATVPRSQLRNDLLELLHPAQSKAYAVIVGGTGTGKSTAVRQALQSLDEPVGAVYFMTPVNTKNFGIALAALLGYESEVVDPHGGIRRWLSGTTREEARVVASEEPQASWDKLGDALLPAAAAYKEKHGRPLVLVIDAADFIAKKDSTFLANLQDFAKLGADMGTLRLVFMSCDGITLPMLMGRSAWSRALKKPYEVGELDDSAAVSFLVSRGVDSKVAAEAVETITGGRFASLNDFVALWQKETTAAIRHQMDVATRTVLMDVGIDNDNAIFGRLLQDRRIESDAARRLVPRETLGALVAKNVIAVHPDGTYGFQSRQVEKFFEDAFTKRVDVPPSGVASVSESGLAEQIDVTLPVDPPTQAQEAWGGRGHRGPGTEKRN